MSRRPTLTISTTDSSGTANTSPSISTIKLGRMASVKRQLDREGRAAARVRCRRRSMPLSSSIFDRTMSMPTPRPDTSVTFSAVLRPGSQMS